MVAQRGWENVCRSTEGVGERTCEAGALAGSDGRTRSGTDIDWMDCSIGAAAGLAGLLGITPARCDRLGQPQSVTLVGGLVGGRERARASWTQSRVRWNSVAGWNENTSAVQNKHCHGAAGASCQSLSLCAQLLCAQLLARLVAVQQA